MTLSRALHFQFGLALRPAGRQAGFGQDIKVLVNHIGYEQDGPKRAVILGHAGDDVTEFKVIDDSTGEASAVRLRRSKSARSIKWKDWYFWTADFSSIKTEGTYVRRMRDQPGQRCRSFPFQIQRDLLERNTLSSVIYYFKGQRCSGLLDKADRHLKFEDSTDTIDVHGGWYDATGDYGKHLGGLSFSTYFNMQPTPVAAWSLFKAYQELDRRGDPSFRQFKRRLLDEAMYGADFLVRMKNPGGSFYRTVDAPGPEKRPEDRRIGKEGVGFAIKTSETKNNFSIGNTNKIAGKFPYEVGWRSGGGRWPLRRWPWPALSPCPGIFQTPFISRPRRTLLPFWKKTISPSTTTERKTFWMITAPCSPAVELFKATKDAEYKAAADRRAANLMDRLVVSGNTPTTGAPMTADRPVLPCRRCRHARHQPAGLFRDRRRRPRARRFWILSKNRWSLNWP